jgi:hypothetical protein
VTFRLGPWFSVGLLALGLAAPSPRRDDAPTYAGRIRPVLAQKCVSCHTEGGSAPFPLRTYDQVKKRDDLVLTMALTRKMPPCYATSDFGEFCPGGVVSDEEGVAIQQWVAAGSPPGELGDEPPAPDPRSWRLGRPDAVLRPQGPIAVQVEGRPYWRSFVVPLRDLQGRRLRAFDVLVDSPETVRWVQVGFARPGVVKKAAGQTGIDTAGSLLLESSQLVGTWAPSYPAWTLPDDVSMPLDGEALIVQLLYLPRGREESGGFDLGLYFSSGRSDRTPKWLTLGVDDFRIPAFEALRLQRSAALPRGSEVLAVVPEARFYCSGITLAAGWKRLFWTRKWEPYWQGNYQFAEPVKFPDGAILTATWEFDNDIHMGRNEAAPPRELFSGYSEWTEMAQMHVLYVPTAGRR